MGRVSLDDEARVVLRHPTDPEADQHIYMVSWQLAARAGCGVRQVPDGGNQLTWPDRSS